MKKMLFTFLIASGIFSCICRDIMPRWNIEDFELVVLDQNEQLPSIRTVEGDSVLLRLELVHQYVAFNAGLNELFAPSLMATSCEPEGQEGMRDLISDITITSDTQFNSFEPNTPLNSIVRPSGSPDLATFTANSESLNAIENFIFDFFIIQKPETGTTHKFTVKMDFESGRSIEKTALKVTWN